MRRLGEAIQTRESLPEVYNVVWFSYGFTLEPDGEPTAIRIFWNGSIPDSAGTVELHGI